MQAALKIQVLFLVGNSFTFAQSALVGRITDPQGKPVSGAKVQIESLQKSSQTVAGAFQFANVPSGKVTITAVHPSFQPVRITSQLREVTLQFTELASQKQSIVITADTVEPTVDLRNSEVFNRTLFTRDDQMLQQMNAGISAGQHEGGGKSLEIRRFGFNLDHGGVNGGLKVMVDNVEQNQGTQGHGQGYLGSLKSLVRN